MTRTLITGHPWTGKTELARSMSPAFRDTDETIPLGWSEGSAEVATWFNAPGPWVICGVAIPRALRKWLPTSDAKPCDHVIVLVNEPFKRLNPGQLTMAKGHDKVWVEIAGPLIQRGVHIEYRRLVFDAGLQGKRVGRG